MNFPIKVGDETYFTDSKGQISRTILAKTYPIGLDSTSIGSWISCQSNQDSASVFAGSRAIDLLFIKDETSLAKSLGLTQNLRVYPNPVLDNLKVEFFIRDSGMMNYEVFTSVGTKIMEGNKYLLAGENKFDFEMNEFSKGVYYLKLFQGNSQTAYSISKFIKL